LIDHKTTQLSTPFFQNLNGLRFVGALMVFLFHCFTLGREVWGDFFSSPVFEKVAKVFSKGHHGVGLFFVLSGFLITYLLLHEAKKNERINAFGFFMRRMLRIWPLYLIIVIFGFFIFPLLPYGIETTHSLTNYALYLSNFDELINGSQDAVNFLTVTWSVSIEEQFYIAWVVLIALIPAMRKGRYFPYYFTLLILSSIVFRFIYWNDERILYFHTLSVVSDLAIGGYLSYLCFHKRISEKIKHLPKGILIIVYVIGTALVLASTKIFQGQFTLVERLFIGAFFAFIIFEQVYCSNSFYKADKVLGFYKLGEVSYGLYMYHCIVIYYVQQVMNSMGWTHSLFHFLIFILVSALLTYSISWVSYRFLESPLLKLKRYFR